MSELEEINERISRAIHRLHRHADFATGQERLRLLAKVTGVELARSYVNDALKQRTNA